jgi:alpha-1,6-mannosyltransferase
MWPELQGIYFNVVQGKSVEWGVSRFPLQSTILNTHSYQQTSPFYSYWAVHLPKLLTGAFPFSLLGVVVDKRARSVALPAITFVTIMSYLGHKEWRFIIYVIPIFNLCAACAFTWL